jgi:hypothetical protein
MRTVPSDFSHIRDSARLQCLLTRSMKLLFLGFSQQVNSLYEKLIRVLQCRTSASTKATRSIPVAMRGHAAEKGGHLRGELRRACV